MWWRRIRLLSSMKRKRRAERSFCGNDQSSYAGVGFFGGWYSEGWKRLDGHLYLSGYRFKIVDRLITNFHLPESTLIMLVSALAGKEHIMAAYEEAVKDKYRFFSFGDAMFYYRRNRMI